MFPIGFVKVKFNDGSTDVELVKNVAADARDAEENWVEKFEVGKIYRSPWDKKWLVKVLSRTDSSIKVAIKSERSTSWGRADEQVTLRINKKRAEEDGIEVAKGFGWEFWADVKA